MNALRLQRRLWRVAALFGVVCISLTSLAILRSSAVSLLENGPAHDEFVTALNRELSRQVLPHTKGFDPEVSAEKHEAAPMQSPAPTDQDGTQLVSETPDDTGRDEMPGADISGRAKVLTHFRQQTVTEYQDTVKKIIEDLTAIREAEGGSENAGLPAHTVAILLINRLQEAGQKPTSERAWTTFPDTAEDNE